MTGLKVKADGPVTYNPTELAKRDTLNSKSVHEKPIAIPNPGEPLALHESKQQGEPLLDLLISIEPKPKVNEPTRLILSVVSTVPRDSVVVYLLYAGSIKIIR